MNGVDLKCPYCEHESEYDFCEMNCQEETYEIECHSCGKEFKVFNEWNRSVTVLCLKCNGDPLFFGCEDE